MPKKLFKQLKSIPKVISIAKKKKEFKNFKIESDQKFKLKITKNSKKEEIEKQVSSMIERMKILWESTTYKYKDTYWKWMMNCLKIDPEERPKAIDLYNEGLSILQKEDPEKYKITKIQQELQFNNQEFNISNWLTSIELNLKYLQNFETNGYDDLKFLFHLQKEDLEMIEIEDENDVNLIIDSLKKISNKFEERKKKKEFDFFNVPCWLKSIGLSIYSTSFDDSGFDDIEYIWENGLTDFEITEIIGIDLIGHLKKLKYSIQEMQRILCKKEGKFEINKEEEIE